MPYNCPSFLRGLERYLVDSLQEQIRGIKARNWGRGERRWVWRKLAFTSQYLFRKESLLSCDQQDTCLIRAQQDQCLSSQGLVSRQTARKVWVICCETSLSDSLPAAKPSIHFASKSAKYYLEQQRIVNPKRCRLDEPFGELGRIGVNIQQALALGASICRRWCHHLPFQQT